MIDIPTMLRAAANVVKAKIDDVIPEKLDVKKKKFFYFKEHIPFSRFGMFSWAKYLHYYAKYNRCCATEVPIPRPCFSYA